VRILAQLAAEGRYGAVADEVFSRVLPPQNPYFNWDKFLVLGLAAPQTALARPPSYPTRATLRDMQALCAQHPEQAEVFARRLEEGQECHVYRDGDRIVGRQWLIPDRADYATNGGWRFVPAVRPALWVHDLYIEPAYRLRGYFVGFMENALRARDGERPHVYAEVHFRNDPSLKACLRYGYQVVQEVSIWTLLGVRLYVAKDGTRRRRYSVRLGFDSPRR
jgi:GNAT superfamily N-acetyltransferase